MQREGRRSRGAPGRRFVGRTGASDERGALRPGERRTGGRSERRSAATEQGASPRPPRDGERLIVGRNPVREAFAAGTRVKRLYLAGEEARAVATELAALARERGVPVETVSREHIDALAAGTAHQGVVAVAEAFRYVDLDTILQRAAAAGEEPFLLLLDHLEDPQNFGSLVRTAEEAGVHGVVIPERRAVGVTPAVGKASAGAVEHLPIARVKNLVRAMERLKAAGVWIAGADMEGEEPLHGVDLSGPIAVVIGAEGEGLSRLVAERCDWRVRIPMVGRVGSLNAAVAGALLMYEVVRHRSRTVPETGSGTASETR